MPAEHSRAIDGIIIGPKVGSCGTAAWCRHPIYVADIANDALWADYRDLALAYDLRAWAGRLLAAGLDQETLN